jgi:exodeoxyribonuclease V alpha subunit
VICRAAGVIFLPRGDILATDDVTDLLANLGGFSRDTRILCATRSGPTGIEAINSRLHSIMALGLASVAGFAVGEPVMFLKNDYRRDLRNGSLGTVTAAANGVVTADFDGTTHDFSGPAPLEDLTLAYAITVHKAQGSQFRRVIIPIVPTRLLDRSLIYTALTRATESAVFVGPRVVLAAAISREQVADRRDVAQGHKL